MAAAILVSCSGHPTGAHSASASPSSTSSPTASTAPGIPPAREGPALAYDDQNHRLILFGGANPNAAAGSMLLGDTWGWDGSQWVELHPVVSAPGRSFGDMASGEPGAVDMLFGGGAANIDPPRNDTWTWNGQVWSQQQAASSPAALAQPSIAYDDALKAAVLVGTTPGAHATETWVWSNGHWGQQSGAQPAFRFEAALAYDARRQQLVLFGGYQTLGPDGQMNDTWTWNGRAWQQAHPASSPPGGPAFAAYDPDHQVVLLFSASGQTWTWDGTNWTQRHPNTNPSPRLFAAIADDPAAHQVVMFGGKIDSASGTSYSSATWTWDGTDWTRRT